MFGGYTDVAAYYMDTSDLAINANHLESSQLTALPKEFLPVYTPPNPWHRGGSVEDDFILIAEFSEQEGPKPLITIPKDGGGSFDLNSFAVRILSVDHHAVGGVHSYDADDTPVVLTETREGVYAYVHHYTLHDSQARGFVRPFCMAYVTADENKIMKFYEDISSKFEMVSKCFKCGNHELFTKDMGRYMQDLHYTRERFAEREEALKNGEKPATTPEEELILKGSNLPSIDSFIKEIKEIISKVNKNSREKLLEEKFRGCSRQHGSDVCRVVKDDLSDTSSLDGSLHSYHLSSSTRLSSSYSSRNERDNWKFLEQSSSYKPKVVRTVNRRRFDKELRNLHELCLLGAKEGLNRLRSIHKHFQRDLSELLIEKRDAAVREPKSALLTIGGSVAVNFLSHKMKSMFDSSQEELSDLKALHNKNFEKKRISEDEASLHSMESFATCRDDDNTSSSSQFVTSQSLPEGTDNWSSLQSCFTNGDAMYIKVSDDANDASTVSTGGFTPQELSDEEYGTPGDGSQFSLDPSDDHAYVRQPDVSSAMNEDDRISDSPGVGILAFLHVYPFSTHLIYSLLTGATVVILGNQTMEKTVQSVIKTLWLFVPAHVSRGHSVIWWHQDPLKDKDLSHMKLVGLCRPNKKSADHMIPSSVRDYVTVLNLEQKTLWSPQYHGDVITALISKKKNFKDDRSFIPFIQSVLLELATRAFVYYHAFWVNSPSVHKADLNDFYQARHEIDRAGIDFLGKLGINQQDAKIVQYLTEKIIWEQSSNDHFAKDPRSRFIKVNKMKCVLFKT